MPAIKSEYIYIFFFCYILYLSRLNSTRSFFHILFFIVNVCRRLVSTLLRDNDNKKKTKQLKNDSQLITRENTLRYSQVLMKEGL